jgi:hypothetical protein
MRVIDLLNYIKQRNRLYEFWLEFFVCFFFSSLLLHCKSILINCQIKMHKTKILTRDCHTSYLTLGRRSSNGG